MEKLALLVFDLGLGIIYVSLALFLMFIIQLISVKVFKFNLFDYLYKIAKG